MVEIQKRDCVFFCCCWCVQITLKGVVAIVAVLLLLYVCVYESRSKRSYKNKKNEMKNEGKIFELCIKLYYYWDLNNKTYTTQYNTSQSQSQAKTWLAIDRSCLHTCIGMQAYDACTCMYIHVWLRHKSNAYKQKHLFEHFIQGIATKTTIKGQVKPAKQRSYRQTNRQTDRQPASLPAGQPTCMFYQIFFIVAYDGQMDGWMDDIINV